MTNKELKFVTDERKIYAVNPDYLATIAKYLFDKEGSQPREIFADRCEAIAKILANKITINGLENLPSSGQVIFIKNHPHHLDFVFFHELFRRIPSLRVLFRKSVFIPNFNDENMFFIEKDSNKTANKSDVRLLHQHLINGGSLMIDPFGGLDHQATFFSSLEQAQQNVLGKLRVSAAKLLVADLKTEFGEQTIFPIKKSEIVIHQPIDYRDNDEEIKEIIRRMFEAHIKNNQMISNT